MGERPRDGSPDSDWLSRVTPAEGVASARQSTARFIPPDLDRHSALISFALRFLLSSERHGEGGGDRTHALRISLDIP